MNIYVVLGSTGEYSDRNEWPVKAFYSEEAAMELIIKATEKAKEIEVTRESRFAVPKELNPFDPKMQMDYTGTHYYYHQVECDGPKQPNIIA